MRKAYQKPLLEIYGDLADLTGDPKKTGNPDGGGNKRARSYTGAH